MGPKLPYELTPVTTEEEKLIKKCIQGYSRPFIRCGEKGYVMPGTFRKYADEIYNFKVRPDDVWVITFPRSGTTWTQEMIWLLENNLDYETSKQSPLYKRFPMLEVTTQIPDIAYNLIKHNFLNLGNFQGLNDAVKIPSWKALDEAPSPRYIKTHMPLSLLPKNLLDTAKVIYVARDPRDVAVSYYYLHKMVAKHLFKTNFKTFWEAFRRDLLPWTPVIEHNNEAWEMRHHKNLHLIFYEDMKTDLQNEIKRTCKFLNRSYEDKAIEELANYLTFSNLRKNKNVNNTVDTNGNVQFLRKGEAGRWTEHFDEEMTLQAEDFLVNGLRGLDLTYPTYRGVEEENSRL